MTRDDSDLTVSARDDDLNFEGNVRPKKLQDYIGQDNVHDQLSVFLEATLKRREPLDHVLIYGPPGLGKTTLANIIANELNSSIIQTSGPVLEKKKDLAGLLTNLEPNDVLFIDEIHRLNAVVEETLYPAMEDQVVDMVLGEGPAARSLVMPINPFTLIGATTRAGLLSSPLRDRFGITQRLEFYAKSDLSKIIERSAKILSFSIDKEACYEIAKRSRGTPRIANRLLRRCRDFSDVKELECMNTEAVSAALDLLKIDSNGFDYLDRKFLSIIAEKFDGGPVGVDTLASALGEERDTIEDVIEPFLIQEGFIKRTPRGREATLLLWNYLGLSPNISSKDSKDLFEGE